VIAQSSSLPKDWSLRQESRESQAGARSLEGFPVKSKGEDRRTDGHRAQDLEEMEGSNRMSAGRRDHNISHNTRHSIRRITEDRDFNVDRFRGCSIRHCQLLGFSLLEVWGLQKSVQRISVMEVTVNELQCK